MEGEKLLRERLTIQRDIEIPKRITVKHSNFIMHLIKKADTLLVTVHASKRCQGFHPLIYVARTLLNILIVWSHQTHFSATLNTYTYWLTYGFSDLWAIFSKLKVNVTEMLKDGLIQQQCCGVSEPKLRLLENLRLDTKDHSLLIPTKADNILAGLKKI